MTEVPAIERTPTGMSGFDQVALGGLPTGRSTLVTGTTRRGIDLGTLEASRLVRVIDSDGPHIGEPAPGVTHNLTDTSLGLIGQPAPATPEQGGTGSRQPDG